LKIVTFNSGYLVMSSAFNPFVAQRNVAIAIALLGGTPLSIGIKLRQLIYRRFFGYMGSNVVIERHVDFVLPQNVHLGDDVAIGRYGSITCWQPNSHLTIEEGTKFSQGIQLHPLGGQIRIGRNVSFDSYICIAGPGNISIGDNCLVASHCGLYANNHVFSDPHQPIKDQPLTCEGIVIEDDCWLGTGVRVLDGVTIGRGSVIGAGAVVTRNIPPYSVAVGVPARVISKRGAEGNTEHELARASN
jgi:acetyltransferase-like isoleucine patch superfamily enzyme